MKLLLYPTTGPDGLDHGSHQIKDIEVLKLRLCQIDIDNGSKLFQKNEFMIFVATKFPKITTLRIISFQTHCK